MYESILNDTDYEKCSLYKLGKYFPSEGKISNCTTGFMRSETAVFLKRNQTIFYVHDNQIREFRICLKIVNQNM